MSPLALASRTDRACVGPELSRESDATRAYRRKMETGPRITRDLTLLTAWSGTDYKRRHGAFPKLVLAGRLQLLAGSAIHLECFESCPVYGGQVCIDLTVRCILEF